MFCAEVESFIAKDVDERLKCYRLAGFPCGLKLGENGVKVSLEILFDMCM